jgi:hypothetical protein
LEEPLLLFFFGSELRFCYLPGSCLDFLGSVVSALLTPLPIQVSLDVLSPNMSFSALKRYEWFYERRN